MHGRTLWALGCVLHEMATGRRAFQSASQAGLIAAILEHDPTPVSQHQPMTPRALDRVVTTCLAKKPEERFQTAHDLRLQLQWMLEGGSEAVLPMTAGGRRKVWERVSWGLAVTASLVAGVLGFAHFRAGRPEIGAINAFIGPPEATRFQAVGRGAGPVAVSPDGTKLAFVAVRADGTGLLFVREMGSLDARPLDGTEGAEYPFWSPDSRTLGFFASGKLRRIEATGGPPLMLCEAPHGRGGAWSATGVVVFAPEWAGPLHRVPATGGKSTPVTRLDAQRGETSHRWPAFLPGKSRFLYSARVGAAGTSHEENAILVGSLDGSEKRLLLRTQAQAAFASGHVLFLRETTLMAQPFDAVRLEFVGDASPVADRLQFDSAASRGTFSVSESDVLVYQTGDAVVGSRLVWFDRSGKRLGELGDQATYYDPRLSPDGRFVAVDVQTGVGQDIWIYDVMRGLRTRFTFDPSVDQGPVWSPDGSRVAFASSRKGQTDLYVKSFAQPGPEEALHVSPDRKLPTSWSPDGRHLAFTIADSKTGSDVWILPLTGDRKPVAFLRSSYGEFDGQFSPDGRWMAYSSQDSGRAEVYVTPFPGPGRNVQVSTSGGGWPRWRRDGREIFYLDGARRIVAVAIDTRSNVLEFGAAAVLFETRPGAISNTIYDVSADGQRFLVNTFAQPTSDSPLTLAVNWTSQLGRGR